MSTPLLHSGKMMRMIMVSSTGAFGEGDKISYLIMHKGTVEYAEFPKLNY